MEEELQCPVCHHLFDDPVILPCAHNVCYKCAESLILKNGNLNTQVPATYQLDQADYKSVDPDKVSLISEAVLSDSDSGYSGGSGGHSERNVPPVIASSVSGLVASFESNEKAPRATSGPTSNGVTMPAMPESVSCLTCPICHRTLFLDERGADGLPRHTLMQTIVGRYAKSKETRSMTPRPTHTTQAQQLSSSVARQNSNQTVPVINHSGAPENACNCQLCAKEPADPAVVKCIQCEVLYCASCRDRCHPPRGPLAKHNLVSLKGTTQLAQNDPEKPSVYRRNKFQPLPNKPSPKNGLKLASCVQHPTEKTSLHCGTCRISLCVQCQEEGRHKTHDVKPIGALFKMQKSELSGQMSALSNKARQAKDLVMLLRETQDDIERCTVDLEAKTVAQCNHLIEAVERKRDELIQRISREKELKSKAIRDQLQQCTMKLKQTTGLLEYCIEIMKDNDVAAFLQISQSLTERVSCTEKQWSSRALVPRVKSEFDLGLESSDIALAIDQLDFAQMKAPEKPIIQVEECGSKNNTVTLAWTMPCKSQVDGYKLEMDNGSSGPFREVYTGSETVCTVDGLHFNSVYRARVRAVNRAGQSPYSDLLHLQTSEVASFQLDTKQNHSDVKLSNSNSTVTSESYDDRVVLGNVGFSRGIHYWEFSVDRYDVRPDPAFGVALHDVDKESMLGKDTSGWSMYVDEARSWLLHNHQHAKRTDNGVSVGSRVGVLLDLTRRCVTFYINGMIQGSPLSLQHKLANPSQLPVFYPAVSINQNVQVTLHTGLRCPASTQQPQLYRNRIKSLSDTDPRQKRVPSPLLKPQLSYDGKPPRGAPPPPPLRRGSSSGNVSLKSEGEASTASDPTPAKSFSSFFQRMLYFTLKFQSTRGGSFTALTHRRLALLCKKSCRTFVAELAFDGH